MLEGPVHRLPWEGRVLGVFAPNDAYPLLKEPGDFGFKLAFNPADW